MGLTPKTLITADVGGNWFGDGSDGHIRITSAGAEQSQDGVVWSALSGWLSSSNTVMIPSIEDGDMTVVNAISLTVDEGMTLTTQYRCRGLLIYTQSDLTNNGIITMTARGCRANPADAEATDDTPVAPTDGNAVPEGGIIIRRLAEGCTGAHTDANLMRGCGLAAVTSEANQPVAQGDGIVIQIPRVGGSGGAGVGGVGASQNGNAGGSASNAPGGGGGGGWYTAGNKAMAGAGATATCFASGAGGGGNFNGGDGYDAQDAAAYGGAGGDSDSNGISGGGGAGNPGGVSVNGNSSSGEDGLAGVLIALIGGDLSGSGSFASAGSLGGLGYGTAQRGNGGSSGGGVIVAMYAGANTFTGVWDVSGGVAVGLAGIGGPGGVGSVIGPIKIDPRG